MSDARHSYLLYKSRERTYFWDFYALDPIVAYDKPLPFYDLPNLELLNSAREAGRAGEACRHAQGIAAEYFLAYQKR